jgi:hypothetical protein
VQRRLLTTVLGRREQRRIHAPYSGDLLRVQDVIASLAASMAIDLARASDGWGQLLDRPSNRAKSAVLTPTSLARSSYFADLSCVRAVLDDFRGAGVFEGGVDGPEAADSITRTSQVLRLSPSAAAATAAALCSSDPSRRFSFPEKGRAGSSPLDSQTWR